jgi:hypothetical protein
LVILMSSAVLRSVAVAFICAAISLRAGVIVDDTLQLTSLQVSPPGGWAVQWISPINASVFVEALNSLGGLDSKSANVDDAALSRSATVTWASASASADGAARTASAASHILLPDITGSASSTARGTLSGSFQIVGTGTGPLSVDIGATLAGSQHLSVSGLNAFGSSEIIFNLLLPDLAPNPILHTNNLLTSTGGIQNMPFSGIAPTTVTLQPNTAYSFRAEVDSESSGFVVVPEPARFGWLAGMALLMWKSRRVKPA